MAANIYLAFRFHGNFYHSYRGDTPDELGFGKDIRVIRHILSVLDDFNQKGVPVSGTWDFENYFSFEKIMPAHCPDIVESIQRRVKEGRDEVQLMSYNNGLINAHTPREFEAAMRRALTNPAGSGVRDLFGEGVYPMVRPQEMMYTPIHLKLYKGLGIDSISLYYSCVPFNGFSNFVPLLSIRERYNPLTLTYPGIDETLTLLPAYNVGDLADHLTLRRWVKAMRSAQLRMEEPCDLLLLLDQDADDAFWYGFDAPGWLKKRFSSLRGLSGLLEDVLDLDYVRFTTPGRYLQDHPPVNSISIGQDTADGSYDGLSSWAEKWSNHHSFTGLERARILDLQTRRLLGEPLPADLQARLDDSFEARLKALSTTHFGMAAPVMNLTRERGARELVQQAVDTAAAAFSQAAGQTKPGSFRLLDYPRGESTSLVTIPARPSRALIRLPLQPDAPDALILKTAVGSKDVPCVVIDSLRGRELVFVEGFRPGEEKQYVLQSGRYDTPGNVSVTEDGVSNGLIHLRFDAAGQVSSVQAQGREFSAGRFFSSGVTYGRRSYWVESWQEECSLSLGVVGLRRARGTITLPDGYPVEFEREILLADGLPYIYVDMRVVYPRTPDKGFDRAKAKRLQQGWDEAWREVLPCQISPVLAGRPESPLRVWKHNYCDHTSTYDLDYGRFSANRQLPNANNQITHAWLAVTDGELGLLIAQTADVSSNVAFCPLRTHRQGLLQRVLLNPFGSYAGRQYRYATAETNLGNLLATTFSAADQLKPYAPSYNGRVQEFSLMLALYTGDCPPEALRCDAEAFAYPYAVLNDGVMIANPPHRAWDGGGLGSPPPGL